MSGQFVSGDKMLQVYLILLQLLLATPNLAQTFNRIQKQLQATPPQANHDNVVAEMQVVCQSDAIILMVNTNNPFNGMLYARDAPSSNNCISEFHSSTNMTFRLPLKSCGTLSAEVDDGIEYFNTVVVQPHMRLMTNQGKGYHIRCKYQTRERTIANTHFNVSAAFLMQNQPQSSTAPLLATASMPMCTMKIYRIDQDNVAESVKVGDKLVMVIEIDKQDMYGMRITNCVVRDGLNKAEQLLINDQGCPVDETIMPKFEYENNGTRAAVAFKAHKFPHTSSVYYQCNVRLCINNGGCEPITCQPDALASSASSPAASSNTVASTMPTIAANLTGGGSRSKRFILGQHQLTDPTANQQEVLPNPSELRAPKNRDNDLSFDVYSGLYVSDVSDIAESYTGDPDGQQVLPVRTNGNNSPATSSRDGLAQLTGGAGDSDSCFTAGEASLMVIVASFGSVALVLLIACQVGLVGSNSPGQRHSQQASRSFGSSGDLSYSPSMATHHSGSSSGGRPSQYSGVSSNFGSRAACKNMSPLRYGMGLMY